jgi:hypothetical protein
VRSADRALRVTRPGHTGKEIAKYSKYLGVSRATLYRYRHEEVA